MEFTNAIHTIQNAKSFCKASESDRYDVLYVTVELALIKGACSSDVVCIKFERVLGKLTVNGEKVADGFMDRNTQKLVKEIKEYLANKEIPYSTIRDESLPGDKYFIIVQF